MQRTDERPDGKDIGHSLLSFLGNTSVKDFTFSKRTHWSSFKGFDIELYGKKIDLDSSKLKCYQDLLVVAFIEAHVPPGAKMLEVGGGASRVLKHFAKTHECWNIDKMEGLGNGPKADSIAHPYKVVLDYMGNYSPELPDNYFDFVFSISALEHVPQDNTELFDNIIGDINRALKSGGYSLHLFDVIFKKNGFWSNKFVPYIFKNVETINPFVSYEDVKGDKNLYCMSEEVYNEIWMPITKKTFDEHGKPSNMNVLWLKS
jgi:ubiquinone/menaquinone biosynthesis C-methylase UbiE